MRAAPLALVGLLAVGCAQKSPPQTPEAAWSRFSEALRQADAKVAWDSLSKASRAELETRSKAVSEASHGVVKDDPQAMLFQSGVRPREITAAKRLTADEREATLEITVGGRNEQVHLVQEDGAWRVDLAGAIKEVTRRD